MSKYWETELGKKQLTKLVEQYKEEVSKPDPYGPTEEDLHKITQYVFHDGSLACRACNTIMPVEAPNINKCHGWLICDPCYDKMESTGICPLCKEEDIKLTY
jgi:hypothetical protein